VNRPGPIPRLLATLFVALAAAFAAARAGAAPPATFVPPTGSSLAVRALDAEGRTFLSVGDVASALGGTLAFEPATGSYELRIGAHTAVFGTETPIAVVDTRLVQLASPIRGEGSTAFADADFFTRVLSPLFGVTFNWDKGARTLAARRVETPEIGVEATVSAFEGTTKVVFRFTQAPPVKAEKGDEQLVLRFPGVKLVPAVPEVAVDDPRVARLLLRPGELAVLLKGKNLSTNVYSLSSPPRVVVDVTRAAPPPPAPAPAGTRAPGALVVPTPAPRPEPKVVVLDPGHGGTEEGAKAPAASSRRTSSSSSRGRSARSSRRGATRSSRRATATPPSACRTGRRSRTPRRPTSSSPST